MSFNFMSASISLVSAMTCIYKKVTDISMKAIAIILIPYAKMLQQKKEQTLKCRDSEKSHELVLIQFLHKKGDCPSILLHSLEEA